MHGSLSKLYLNTATSLASKIIAKLEDPKIPLHCAIISFLAAIILRNTLEGFLIEGRLYFDYPLNKFFFTNLHYSLAYISGSMSLILLCYAATRDRISNIAKVILPSYIVLLIAPTIDLILNGHHHDGIKYTYLYQHSPTELAINFFGLLSQHNGATFGMRIEISFALIGLFSYFYIKNNRVISSVIFTFLSYGLIFLYFSAPLILESALNGIGLAYHYSSLIMIRLYLLSLFPLGISIAYLADKNIFLSIMKDMRWLRIGYYLSFLIFGCVLSYTSLVKSGNTLTEVISPTFEIDIIFCCISMLFASLFSIITNNLIDQSIDVISNQSRPLITGSVSINIYRQIGCWSFVFATIYAMAVGVKACTIIFVSMAGYYLYSMPPLRLKIIPILSKLVISLNTLAITALGYLIISDAIGSFPHALTAIFLIGFTLSANFIDIKDYEGDKQNGIYTLPVLLGLKNAKLFIGAVTCATFMSFYLLFRSNVALLLCSAGGLMQFYFINQKKYDEKIIFLFYIASIFMLIAMTIYYQL